MHLFILYFVPCFNTVAIHSAAALSLEPSQCPMPGRYNILTGSASCDSYFRSGCNGTSVIDIISTCSSRPGERVD